MRMVDLIEKKRDGGVLTDDEIRFIIKGFTDGSIPDYQMSAFAMTVFYKGMTDHETAVLTDAMMRSGDTVDLSRFGDKSVDKHSTGGVGDKTTLIVAPIVSSLGGKMAKMSGRGLGHTGGTVDKLESIPGFRVDVTEEEALRFAKESGIVLMSQTDNLTPADKKLYALRDVTGTVDSIPLIAASIMSKKIAAGADAIVLDVKCGSGAFMKNAADAERLAGIMADMGRHVGRRVTAVISSMAQPLGMYIGNSLEVMEAIEVLKGNVGGDLLEVSLTLGANMLLLAERVQSEEEGKALLLENIRNGKGLAKFKELLIQQGGDVRVITDYSLLPLAEEKWEVKATKSGYLTRMDTAMIGRASQETGAGRMFKGQTLDFGAGIVMKKRTGDVIATGETLAVVYSKRREKCQSAADFLQKAITIEAAPLTEQTPLILKTIRQEG